MAERAFISLLAVVLLFAGYHLFKRLQLRAVNRSTRGSDQEPVTPSILYFWSPSCTVCRTAQKPTLEQLTERIGSDQVQLTSVDVSEQPELASRYHVLTVPTTLILDTAGKVKHMNNGLVGLAKLLQQIEETHGESSNSSG